MFLKAISSGYKTRYNNKRQPLSVTIKCLKVVLAAMLGGKSMPSNMAANTNHTPLLKNRSATKYLPRCTSSQMLGVRSFLCTLSILVINRVPSHFLKEALVT